MNPNREEALFQLALAKSAGRRAAFLDATCEAGCGGVYVSEQTEPVRCRVAV